MNLIILVDHKLNISQQHVATAKRANAMQQKCSTEITGKDISAPCCTGQPTPEILYSDVVTTTQEKYQGIGENAERSNKVFKTYEKQLKKMDTFNWRRETYREK